MYNERSAFVHGGKNPVEEGSVKAEDIVKLGNLVRQAILCFGTLYVQGEGNRDRVLNEIQVAVLDSEVAAGLRERSDVGAFLKDFR